MFEPESPGLRVSVRIPRRIGLASVDAVADLAAPAVLYAKTTRVSASELTARRLYASSAGARTNADTPVTVETEAAPWARQYAPARLGGRHPLLLSPSPGAQSQSRGMAGPVEAAIDAWAKKQVNHIDLGYSSRLEATACAIADEAG